MIEEFHKPDVDRRNKLERILTKDSSHLKVSDVLRKLRGKRNISLYTFEKLKRYHGELFDKGNEKSRLEQGMSILAVYQDGMALTFSEETEYEKCLTTHYYLHRNNENIVYRLDSCNTRAPDHFSLIDGREADFSAGGEDY